MPSYVPILKWKQGEQRALAALLPNDRAGCIPLLDLLAEAFESSKKSLVQVCDDICDEIAKCWGPAPAFVDFDDDIDSGVVTQLFASARARELALVPVTALWRPTQWQSAVAAVIAADKRGVCLRVSPEEIYGQTFGSDLAQLAATLGCAHAAADLLLDWGPIDEGDGPRTAITLRAALPLVPQIASWRSITFAASAFPKLLSDVGVGRGVIARAEWEAHGLLISAPGLARPVAFGDYAIAYPIYEPTPYSGSAAIRYTVTTEWLIFRGRSLRLPGAYKQFPALCQQLVADPQFCGSGFSWGDDQIVGYASGNLPGTGNTTTWRAVGTNHHVTFVARQVASRFAPSGKLAPPSVGP